MSKLSYAEVVGLRNVLRNDLSRILPKWELLSEYIAPERFRKTPDDKHNHIRKDSKIIKNQAGRSLRTFVSGMMNGATPRARPWFNLTVNNNQKANSAAARRYFSQSEAILNSHFQMSNLYRILPMSYKDVGIFSNSAFAMLPDPKYGFWFYPFAIGTYAFSCDAQGNTNMFTRDFSLTVKEVVDQYAKLKPNGHIDFSNIPSSVKAHYDAARYLEIVVLTLVIVPNPKYNPKKKTLDPADKRFQSYTYLQSMGALGTRPQHNAGFRAEKAGGQGEFIKVSGFDYFPVITPRWEVQAEENYGVDAPGDIALSDIMSLQTMEAYRTEAVAKLVKPPMIGPASLKRHQSSILAGGMTYVDDAGTVQSFKPAFEVNPNISSLLDLEGETVQAIRSSFYEDLFLMLSGGETKTHVTAREIDEKASERMSALAPALGQLDQDQNSKIIRNALMILESTGRLPPRPQELKDEEMRPEYISILAQAAKVSMMNSMERTMNFATSVANALQDPALAKLINGEASIRKYADYTAMDPSLILDEDEFAAVRQQIAQQQQAQAAAAMEQQQAATIKDLSAAKIGEGSMLDTMLTASRV